MSRKTLHIAAVRDDGVTRGAACGSTRPGTELCGDGETFAGHAFGNVGTYGPPDREACHRCVSAVFGDGRGSQGFGAFARSVYDAAVSAAVAGDGDIHVCRQTFEGQVTDLTRYLQRAIEDVTREARSSVPRIATDPGYYRGAAQLGAELFRLAHNALNNARLDLLVRYGADLDAAVRKAVERAEASTAAALQAAVEAERAEASTAALRAVIEAERRGGSAS